MPVLNQICLVFGLCLLSEGLAALVPMPSSIIAMVLLLILLAAKVVKPQQLQQTSEFLLDHMTLCFVPVVTGIMTYVQVLLDNFWVIVLISILTTPVVFFVTGQVVQLTMKWMCRREACGHDGSAD